MDVLPGSLDLFHDSAPCPRLLALKSVAISAHLYALLARNIGSFSPHPKSIPSRSLIRVTSWSKWSGDNEELWKSKSTSVTQLLGFNFYVNGLLNIIYII